MEDNQIIALFLERSEQAIREVEKKYGRLCMRVAMNILNDRTDAEECVNDAYFGAWNAIPPEKPEPLRAYLCKIVRNIALNRYYAKTAAKRNSRYDVAMEELEAVLAAPDTAAERIEAKELTETIECFLDSLSRENRVIFLRRYWFSDSYEEIAERVGLTEKNISVRLTRMRKQLKNYLKERGVFV